MRAMHQFATEEMVQERQQELRRLSQVDRQARALRVPAWRERAGRALASLAVAVAVPRSHRPTVRCRVGALLSLEPPH